MKLLVRINEDVLRSGVKSHCLILIANVTLLLTSEVAAQQSGSVRLGCIDLDRQ